MIYQYKATNKHGKKTVSFIDAESKGQAIQKLQADNYVVLTVKEKKDSKLGFLKRSVKIPLREKLFFTKNLSEMVSSGLTLSESIGILKEQAENKNMRYILAKISADIQGGQKLAQSISNFPHVFSPVYVHMVEAGEQSGNLDTSLKHLDIQLEKENDLRKKIKSAFIYPAVILSMTGGLGVFLLVFILPKIAKIFTSFNMDLPLPTRILIASSLFLKEKWYLVLAGLIVAAFGVKLFLRNSHVKPAWHKIILKLPIIGNISAKANLAKVFRVISSLLKSGIPLVKTLDITASTANNLTFQTAINDACFKTAKGGSLSEILAENEKLFPPLATKMLGVGEKTGNLPKSCEHLAKNYEEEVDNLTKNLSTLLEPILLVFMGVAIGGIAISIISPIYKLPSMIQQR